MGRGIDEKDTQRWTGEVAAGEDPDTIGRRWVVWGTGAADQGPFSSEPGDEVAMGIAAARDPEWAEMDDRWAVTVSADEAEVDSFIEESVTARGYAGYLVPGKTEEMPEGYMKGRLRGDVGPRRKVNQPRPYR